MSTIALATAFDPVKLDPDSSMAKMMRARGVELPEDGRRRVLGTRYAARELIEKHTGAEPPAKLDFAGIEVASSAFIHELLTAWPQVRPVNANAEVQETWEFVAERRQI